jgi:hypothetical protein
MRLTDDERDNLTAGDLTIRRKVRVNVRTGREKGTAVSVGDTVKLGSLCLAVKSVRKERSGPEISAKRVREGMRQPPAEWVIEFEEVGEWAIEDPGDEIPLMPWAEVLDLLPERLTWDKEPGTRAGDLFVFEWGRTHFIDDNGVKREAPFPALYLRVTTNPIRHTKGHWQASFQPVGFDRTEFMRRGAGTTPNPLESIDPHAPLETVSKDADQEEEEARARKERTLLAELKKAKGPGAQARIRNELRRAA